MIDLPQGPGGEIEAGGRRLELTSLDRLLWPGFSKRDLISYYARVADVLVPHLAGRALTMVRFPLGVRGRAFLQNECRGAPPWMTVAPLRLQTGELRRYCVIDDLASLLWVANLGTVELHPYPSLAEREGEPLALLLDLDVGEGTSFRDACRVALAVREIASRHRLRPLPKASGGTGLHLYAPLPSRTGFDEARTLARSVAAAASERMPDLVSPPDARSRRPGKVLVDWLQNDPRRSTIAPYSLRAGRELRVSMPLHWHEVEQAASAASGRGPVFGPDEALRRIEAEGDLFEALTAGRPSTSGRASGSSPSAGSCP